jgi:hypothetical protein
MEPRENPGVPARKCGGSRQPKGSGPPRPRKNGEVKPRGRRQLDPAKERQVRQSLDDGLESIRTVAAIHGVNKSTVERIAKQLAAEHDAAFDALDGAAAEDDEELMAFLDSSPYYCPGCDRQVTVIPCVECAARQQKKQQPAAKF